MSNHQRYISDFRLGTFGLPVSCTNDDKKTMEKADVPIG